MRVVEIGSVVAAEGVAGDLWLLHLDTPQIARQVEAGQAVLVRCGDPAFPTLDPYLPRAYFVFAADPAAGRLSILVARRGRCSAWLCSRREGDQVAVHGPIGRGVRPARLTRHLLLLADGSTAAAGLALLAAQSSRSGRSVTLLENVAGGDERVPARLLPPDVEYRGISPETGGLLGALPPLLRWADEVVVAAPPALLDTLAILRRQRHEPFTLHAGVAIQALPLPWLPGAGALPGGQGLAGGKRWRGGGDWLPCGAGWCGACAVATRAGQALLCHDGPAFPLEVLRFAATDDDEA